MRELNEEDFEPALAQGTALVDFSASWCRSCQLLAPVVTKLAKDYATRLNVYRVDVDSARALAARHGVMSVPTMVLFRDGKAIARRIGSIDERDLREMIDGEFT